MLRTTQLSIPKEAIGKKFHRIQSHILKNAMRQTPKNKIIFPQPAWVGKYEKEDITCKIRRNGLLGPGPGIFSEKLTIRTGFPMVDSQKLEKGHPNKGAQGISPQENLF